MSASKPASKYARIESPFIKQLKNRFLALVLLLPVFLLVLIYLAARPSINLGGLVPVSNLFGTTLREAGPATMAVLTKGSVTQFIVNPDGTGLVTTDGGDQSWVLLAGYMFSVLLPAILFWVNNRTRWGHVIAAVFGTIVIILTIIYRASLSGGVGTNLIGLFVGISLLAIGVHQYFIPEDGKRLPDWVAMLCVNVVVLFYGIGAMATMFTMNQTAGGTLGDIVQYANIYDPNIPVALVITIFLTVGICIWLAVSLDILYRLFTDEDKTKNKAKRKI